MTQTTRAPAERRRAPRALWRERRRRPSMRAPSGEELAYGTVEANGVRLRYRAMGRGPLVLLLHGFPDFSYTWREQLPALAAAGYRAVAPDLRGYARSDKPRRVRSYDVDVLADDVAALVQALGERRAAAVVGHDWGGVIAWRVAERHPGLVERLVVLNAPRPGAIARALRSPEQLLRSSYAFFFQLPLLPELLLRAGDYALPLRMLRHGVLRPGAVTDEDLAHHRRALAQPRALTAALAYYRAAGRRMLRRRRSLPDGPVAAPVLVLWGERDPALAPWLADEQLEHSRRGRLVRHHLAGHWVHLDEPAAVSQAIVGWLREAPADARDR